MHRRRMGVAALLAAIALAAPAAAWGQSAGDDQYQDPFGGDEGQSQGSESPDSSSSSGDQSTSTPTTQAPAPTAAPEASTAQAAPAAAASQQLPRTGWNVALPAVAGFWLLLGGVALRARVRLHDRGA
jgi:beta-lactamase class A